MYSVIDRSNLEKTVFDLIKESLADFSLTSLLIDDLQVGDLVSVSKMWEEFFNYVPNRFPTHQVRVCHVLHSHDIYDQV